VNEALAFERIYSQCSIYVYYGAFGAFENDAGGVKANLLYQELSNCTEYDASVNGGGRVNTGQLYREYRNGNLLPFAKDLFVQYNQVYARHLTPAELARFNSDLKPKLVRIANLASYLDCLSDSDAFNLAPYGSPAEIVALPGCPANDSYETLEEQIQYMTALWAFFDSKIHASLPAIPSGNPADPGR